MEIIWPSGDWFQQTVNVVSYAYFAAFAYNLYLFAVCLEQHLRKMFGIE